MITDRDAFIFSCLIAVPIFLELLFSSVLTRFTLDFLRGIAYLFAWGYGCYIYRTRKWYFLICMVVFFLSLYRFIRLFV